MLVLNALGLFAGAKVLAKVTFAQNLTMRLMILSIRALTPLAFLLVARNALAIVRSANRVSPRQLLYYAASAWAFAEVLFWVYLTDSWRTLDSQSTRRWTSILAHSTPEKRRASLSRYLLMIAQVSRGGSDGSIDASSLVEYTSRQNRVKRLSSGDFGDSFGSPVQKRATSHEMLYTAKSLSMSRGPSNGSLSPMKRGLGERGLGVARIFSSSNLLNSMAPMKTREASVSNLLEQVCKPSSTACKTSTEALSDEEFQRLKTLEIAGWFHGSDSNAEPENPAVWLHRGNVEDWIAHYWFRGATPEELASQPGGYEELTTLVDMVLDFTGLSLPEGRNPTIRPRLMMSDPLAVAHRPLLVYVGSAVICPAMTTQVMRFMGFQRERIGGLSYWHRGARDDRRSDVDLAGPRQIPLVLLHGLGVGLVPYYLFIHRLSQRYSGEILVPEFPFMAQTPWESVPSAREVVAQVQDMLAAHRFQGAHFVGHSFGAVILSWMMKMSPTSIICATFIDPAAMLSLKSDLLQKALWDPPVTAMYQFLRYFVFRELFTVNLICRCTFWEQCTLWPEEITTPAVVELSSEDAVVSSLFVRRLLEHERAARKQRKRVLPMAKKANNRSHASAVDLHQSIEAKSSSVVAPLEVMWADGFIHGQTLFHRKQTLKLFSKMKQMVQDIHS